EGSGRQLRVYVDRPEGIDMDGCEKVSRFLSDRLDEADPIGEPYDLIVSSPGMDRVLRKDEHFARYIGRPAEISLYRGIDGRRKFAALLGEKTEDTLTVTPIDAGTLAPDGAEMHIPLSIISKVNLLVVW
ncbi:MAG: ribosome maturation factor RimP, partial [Clostridiales bacterium]|nr:ribosome maturation factor RimP [Clostridiales bacterium]